MPVTKIQPSGVNTQASFSFANVAVTANLTTSGTLEATGNVALSGANVSLGNVANLKLLGANANTVLSVSSTGNISASLITQENIAAATLDVISGVKVSSIGYPGNDTAADIAGGQTITLTGVGFKAGATVLINGVNASVVTVVSSTSITFTAPAQSAGTYPLYVINTDGATAIAVPGISYSGVPNWSTSAGSLGNVYETTAISNTVTATGDAPVTYSLQTGTLPPGSSLNSANGLISGTSAATGSPTTYTFTIRASDAQNQDTDRQFSLTINPDVVTWSSPANNATISANTNLAMSNVTMSASSAAGYGITYTADTLPTGLSISGANITGTPTVVANTTTTLTATAATTNRTATRTINWVISVNGDTFLNVSTLLLNGEISTPNVWTDDISTNKFGITATGNVRPTAFSPYETVWSNFFGNPGNYLSIANNSAFDFGTGDFTIECFFFISGNSVLNAENTRQATLFCAFIQTNFSNSFPNYSLDIGGNSTTTGTGISFGVRNSSGTSNSVSYNQTVTQNVWHHVAVVKSGSTTTLYYDGTSVSTSTSIGTVVTNGYPIKISGLYFDGGYLLRNELNGYISNLRVVKGSAVYTSNFTPPTSPLTAITNTVLLTCQSNRLRDASTNNFTITRNGDVTVSNFGPFIETDTTTGSGYFDGSGDYLTASANNAFSFGTGDFTIEAWIYRTGASNSSGGIFSNGQTAAGSFGFYISAGVLRIDYYAGTALAGPTTVPINQWNHVAITKSGATLRLFLNGVLDATTTTSSNNTSNEFAIGRSWTNYGSDEFLGYISNLRVVKGTAVYTTNFTPPTSLLTAIANTSALTLQYRTGENNNRFIDTSGLNNIITRNGNTTQGTFTPYSLTGWSNYFDGNGDYLQLPDNAAFDLGSSNFTVESFIYLTGYATADNDGGYASSIIDQDQFSPTNSRGWSFRLVGTVSSWTTLLFNGWNSGGSVTSVTGSFTFSLNTWYHVAAVRSGNLIYLYVNGTLLNAGGTAFNVTINDSTIAPKIGAAIVHNTLNFNYYFTGYISNLRILKGTALYTSNFTIPTSPLTAITNTSLLTCQSNRFVDNSANNFAITRNGDTSVQSFSPFAPSITTPTSYSGYFDGTGDYLSIPDSQTFMNIGTNNLTIEGWVYFNSVGTGTFFGTGDSGGNSSGGVIIYLPSSGTLKVFGPSVSGTITASVVTGTWYHIAVTRQTNTWTLWLNGTSQGTFSDSGSLNPGSSRPLAIGRLGAYDGLYLTGYVSNVRFINGTALYTTNFTPPTSPLTAIANTSLLTCQSSTFIDNSTNNFTITVNGDAAPRSFNPFGNTVTSDVNYSVTTVGGSMYFDGTGDSLSNVENSNLALGSGNFTVEMWLYPLTLTTYTSVWGCTTSAAVATGFHCGFNANGEMFIYQNSGFRLGPSATSGVVRRNAWNHLAIVRNSGVIRFYVNGIAASTTWSTSQDFSQGTNRIGVAPDGSTEYYNGYITDLRILKGTVLYTSNFVPPVAPITPIAGTTLLLNGTNGGIIDYTGKNNLETVGDARTSTAVVKYGSRSLFFDGNGDGLLFPRLDLGSGNLTVEWWGNQSSNLTNFSNDNVYAGEIFAGFSTGALGIITYSSSISVATNIWVYVYGVGTIFQPAISISLNQWNHFALTRASGTWRMFVNGTQVGTSSTTAGTTNIVNNRTIGYRNETNFFNYFPGYIDDFRVTIGVARYTTNFTAPTSAFMTK